MKLINFGDKEFEDTKDKRICIISASEEIMGDLLSNYDLADRIVGVVRKAEKKRGKPFCFAGRNYIVEGPELLSLYSMQEENVILLIVTYRAKGVFDWLASKKEISRKFSRIYYYSGLSYREKYSRTPLKNAILFRSGRGVTEFVKGFDFADNARALFEYMLQKGYNKKYELIWLVDNSEEVADQYRGYEHVRFLSFRLAMSTDKKERDEYYRTIYTAKYIFFTENFTFMRNARRDQIRVQLWHGHGFKAPAMVTLEWQDSFEYMTVTSAFYGNVHKGIFGLRADQMLVTGTPKEDWVYHPLQDWRERLNIPKAGKYVMWLPTYRNPESVNSQHLTEEILHEDTHMPIMESVEMLDALNERLASLDIVLIVKLHPIENQDANALNGLQYSHIMFLRGERLTEEDIQINQLLGNIDALISDYSSVIVDYMLLDRPIGIIVEDEKEYRKHRGFVFEDIEECLPGILVHDYEEFISFLEDVAEGKDAGREKRRALDVKFHDFHDDRNSERVLEALGIGK